MSLIIILLILAAFIVVYHISKNPPAPYEEELTDEAKQFHKDSLK